MKDFSYLEDVFNRGFDDFRNKILKKGLNKIGNNALAYIKTLTPVDTGLLRRRWVAKLIGDASEMNIELSNNTEYAAAVNYGKRKTKGGKTVGKTRGAYMLEKGLNNYKASSLKSDIDALLEELRQSL